MMNYTEAGQIQHLGDYLNILRRRSWIVAFCTIIITIPVVLYTLLTRPVWQSTATLLIEGEPLTSPLTGERRNYEPDNFLDLTFKTHFHLISSRPVLEQVIDRLSLDEPELEIVSLRFFLSRLKKWIRTRLGREKLLNPEEQRIRLVEKLQKKVSVHAVRNTRLVRISVRDHLPERAKEIANAVAEAYIAFSARDRLSGSDSSLGQMNRQLQEVKKRLEAAERAFLAYKEEENIFSIEGRQKIILQKIEEINDGYVQARNQRLELETRLRKLEELEKASGIDTAAASIRTLIDNPLIETLYGQLLETEVERSHLEKVFGPKHPKMLQLENKIENLRMKFVAEVGKEIDSMQSKQAVLRSRERLLQQTISEFEAEAQEMNQKELGYVIRRREVETNRELYNTLLARMKEIDVTDDIDVTMIRIQEPAAISLKPAGPGKLFLWILACGAGVTAGILLAFFLEYMDRSLRTGEEVQAFLNLPVLSLVPKARRRRNREYGITHFPGNDSEENELNAAYRNLWLNISFLAMKKEKQTLLVTSAQEGEGTTTTAANLAYAGTQAGKRVLLIDADTRNISLSGLVPSRTTSGLSGLLEEETLRNAVIKVAPKLYLLPAGESPPDASELIASDRFMRALRRLKKQFDLLIFDTPPTLFSRDTLVLTAVADGVLLVVQSGGLNRNLIRQAVEPYRNAGVDILGVVLNKGKLRKEMIGKTGVKRRKTKKMQRIAGG